MSKVALFDSGVGGVTILKEVVSLLPYEEIIYFADSKYCPYGNKSSYEIVARCCEVVDYLLSLDVKIIVIACNTATTNAIDYLRNKYKHIEFVGTEPAVKPALEHTKSGVVGVIATEGTISSNKVGKLSERYGDGQIVHEISGKGLVELIEEGNEDSQRCYELLRGYLEPLINEGIDCLALGCTHYPFLTSAIEKIINGRDIEIINPAPAIARRVKELLIRDSKLNEGDSEGDIQFIASAGGDEYLDFIKSRYNDYNKIDIDGTRTTK